MMDGPPFPRRNPFTTVFEVVLAVGIITVALVGWGFVMHLAWTLIVFGWDALP